MDNDTFNQGDSLGTLFEHADKQPSNSENQPVVTKAELDHLKSQRETPSPELTLKPDMSVQHAVDSRVSQLNEQKIAYMERRLEANRNLARDDFNRTQQHQNLKELDR